MAKIRIYKLAEELKLEKDDLLEKVKALGIEIKSATSALTDEQAAEVRTKIGGQVAAKADMDEKRVLRKGGSAVIRRRKKVKVEEPEPVVEEPPVVAPAEVAESDPAIAAVADEIAISPEPGSDVGQDAAVAPDSDAAGEVAQPVAKREGPASREDTPRKTTPSQQPGGAGPGGGKGKQRKRVREVVNVNEQEKFGRQITSRGAGQRRMPMAPSRAVSNPRRKRRDAPAPLAVVKPLGDQKRVIAIEDEISVGELAKLAGVKAPMIQGKLMALGIMVTVNQRVDVETCRKVADDLGFEVQDRSFQETEFIKAPEVDAAEDEAKLASRPPVITVMGHVDHGKTSILDAIRVSKVADVEAGGITQHIGAYQVAKNGSLLTFIDTPGHAAFTQMRARGAQVTDLAVLVVAANDGVMPQTVEAIEHCRAADVPMVVAINKCDLPESDPAKTRSRLMEHDIVSEEFGGDVICVNVSAKTGEGLDQLLEMLSLQAEVLELKANPDLKARGVVLESELDKGRGPLATILMQSGTLRKGDTVVAGTEWGRVRILEDSEGNRIKEAGPSAPVRVLGLSGVPGVGETLDAVENERAAKSIIEHRLERERGKTGKPRPRLSLEDFLAQADSEEAKELRVVLKADVGGTREAVKDALEKLSTESVKLSVLSSSVGGITENDVMLASASDAIVLGFSVRPDTAASRAADENGVEIRTYSVIMALLDDVRGAMAGLLPPTVKEIAQGRAEVRETFVIPKIGTVAGSMITDGLVKRNANCRLVRDGVQIYEGKVGSLRRFKDDVAEVTNGYECGIGISTYNDIKVGDVIEVYELQEEPATL